MNVQYFIFSKDNRTKLLDFCDEIGFSNGEMYLHGMKIVENDMIFKVDGNYSLVQSYNDIKDLLRLFENVTPAVSIAHSLKDSMLRIFNMIENSVSMPSSREMADIFQKIDTLAAIEADSKKQQKS